MEQWGIFSAISFSTQILNKLGTEIGFAKKHAIDSQNPPPPSPLIYLFKNQISGKTYI